MKVLYFDCSMGASGDMLAAALLQLVPDPGQTVKALSELNIPGLCVSTENAVKGGIAGLKFSVTIDGRGESEPAHYAHRLEDIQKIIDSSHAPEKAREDARAVYALLADAEAKVHGERPEHIHFHEVGSIDAIADILSVCMLINELSPDRICASPVHVGSGTVKCAHGVLPVPAPATAELLKGISIYSGDIRGELCTPTGAALLKYFVREFGPMPHMTADSIGIGIGTKDFARPNCLRAVLGSAEDEITELCCNIDDMSGEEIGYALEKLMEHGALDAFWEPIGMKKSRPGMRLHTLCKVSDRDKFVKLMFTLTSTIGIRESVCRRYVLRRSEQTAQTPWGPVRTKFSEGFGSHRSKLEFDDVRRIADALGISVRKAREIIDSALKNDQ